MGNGSRAPQPAPAPTNFPHRTTVPLDIVVVALISVGGLMMILGNIVILCNRNYRPIKTKGVTVTLLSSVGGLIWIVATIVVNDHFARLAGSGLDVCLLWTYWLQACFGFASWLNCLTLRLIILYRIFVLQSDNRKYDYALLLLLLVPVIAICSVASVKVDITFQVDPGSVEGDCKFGSGKWPVLLITLLLTHFLIFIGFSFRLRFVMAQFNEYRLIRRGGILSLFLFLLSMVTLQTHAYYKPEGRCFLSAAVASAVFYYFWARNGGVIYNALFNRSKYQAMFNTDLRRLPSEHEREKFSGAFWKMETRLKEVREEVLQYQDRIKHLEDQVEALELDYHGLQQKMALLSSSTCT